MGKSARVLLGKAVVDSNAGEATVLLPTVPLSGYTDLIIVHNQKGSATGQYEYVYSMLNGSNIQYKYTNRDIYQLNGNTGYEHYTGVSQNYFATADYGTRGQFGTIEMYIPSYAGGLRKQILTQSYVGSSDANFGIISYSSNLIDTTEGLFSFHFNINAGTFAKGSSFYIYGISNPSQVSALTTYPKFATSYKGSGGTIVDKGDGYVYHYFTKASGTFTLNSSTNADILVVGGGGAGGGISTNGTGNGGGGAGGWLSFTNQSLGAGSYSITVGAGGIGGNSTGGNGSSSTFQGLSSATGGGGGGTRSTVGNQGASAGGSGSETASFSTSNNPSQGSSGGSGGGAGFYGGGGGGGAGGVGSNGTGSLGGAGGVGKQWLDGIWYASGGGGGVYNTTTLINGIGGRGGAGAGGYPVNGGGSAGYAGWPNTGGGGGGSSNGPSGGSSGGNGGSGIVVVRYPV